MSNSTGRKFLSHVLRNFIEEKAIPKPTAIKKCKFLSHVLRNFIEEVEDDERERAGARIPEPCAQELH